MHLASALFPWHKNMTGHECAVLVFSKAPVPGTVKTRLIPPLDEVEAAELYRQLVERTLGLFINGNIGSLQLWCTPVIDHPFFVDCKNSMELDLYLQHGSDLGERMYNAISYVLSDYKSVLLIGCDCPELNLEDLVTGHKSLVNGCDVVLGPCEDGGYYLIGMRKPHREIFENINWGRASVLDETRSRLNKLGLNYCELTEKWDLDDIDGLERYWKLVSCDL